MSRSEDTLLRLEAALQRLLDGEPKRINPYRKLTIKAVEEEAGLTSGNAHYYPAFIEKVKAVKQQIKGEVIEPKSKIEKLRNARDNEKRMKTQYYEQVAGLKATIAQQAAEHHQLAYALQVALTKVEQLEHDLVEAKRGQVVRIK